MTSETITIVLIDSNIWIGYFTQSEKFEQIKKYVEQTNINNTITPTIVLYEVYRKMYQNHGKEMAEKAAAYLTDRTTIIPMDQIISLKAAKSSSQYQLHMADAIIKATAEICHAKLVTMDTHFQGMENVQII